MDRKTAPSRAKIDERTKVDQRRAGEEQKMDFVPTREF
jgi:hypothetical protein